MNKFVGLGCPAEGTVEILINFAFLDSRVFDLGLEGETACQLVSETGNFSWKWGSGFDLGGGERGFGEGRGKKQECVSLAEQVGIVYFL